MYNLGFDIYPDQHQASVYIVSAVLNHKGIGMQLVKLSLPSLVPTRKRMREGGREGFGINNYASKEFQQTLITSDCGYTQLRLNRYSLT